MNPSIRDSLAILVFTIIIILLGLLPTLVLEQIRVYVVAQSMGALLAGAILGAKRGALSVIVFLLLVALNLPVVAGGLGGLALLTGSTGGLLMSWTLAAFVSGTLIKYFWDRLDFAKCSIIMIVSGVVVVYIPSIIWTASTSSISAIEVLKLTSVYVPGDVIKSMVCAIIVLGVKHNYPNVFQQGNDGES